MEEPSTNTSEMEGASTSEMEGEERLMEAEQQNAAAQTKEKKWEKKSKPNSTSRFQQDIW